jgi:hypothetical protein
MARRKSETTASASNEPKQIGDKALLKEIRRNYTYGIDSWRKIRDERAKDMRYLTGDPWEPKEKEARRQANRPALAMDELNQYTNELVNGVRESKRAIKVIPKGVGSHDKEAELRANMLRDIEYASQAQTAYVTGLEGAVNGSYGFWKWSTEFSSDTASPDAFIQNLRIRQIPNPDNVIIDPDFKKADASDMMWAYILDQVPREQYKDRYPGAELVDFSPEYKVFAPQWIKENEIQVAEYWKVKITKKKLLLIGTAQKPVAIWESDLPEGTSAKDVKPMKVRTVETKKVCQYITNGVEILEENEWVGKWIPIVACWGKEMWVDYGQGTERVLLSLVRLARDPYMLYCYLRSNEMEEAGMTPKAPFIAYAGQLDGFENDWQDVGKVPLAYLQVNAKTEATGETVLPHPIRQPFQPNFAAYEVAAEAMRRGIQAAMGTSSLPTAAQRRNEKSGVALNKIDQAQARGSFHFVDNFTRALEHSGRIGNDLLDKIYDTKRGVGLRKPDDSYSTSTINDPEDEKSVMLSTDGHDVTISTGPSDQSQREAVEDFGEELLKLPDVAPRILDLLIRMRNLGPMGDQMADRVTPPEFITKDGQEPLSPEAAAKLQGMQKQLMAINEYSKKLEEQLQKLQQEKEGQMIQSVSRERITEMQELTKLAIAEQKISLDKAQLYVTTEFKRLSDMMNMVHESIMADKQHGQNMQIAGQQQDADSQMAQQQQQAQAAQQQEPQPTAG